MPFQPSTRWCFTRHSIGILVLLWLAGCASGPPAPVEDLSQGNRSVPDQTSIQTTASGQYGVTRGDTLYSIAFKHGLDYRDLAAWNGIAAPYRIYPGQALRLNAPATTTLPAPGVALTQAVPERTPQNPIVEKSAPAPTPFENVEPAPVPAIATVAAPVPPASAPATASPQAPVAVVVKPEPATPPSAPKSDDRVAQLNAGGVLWQWPSDGKVIGTYVAGDQTRQGVDIAGNAGDPVRAAGAGDVVYSGNGLIGYGELIIIKHNASYLSAYGHNRKRLVKEGDHVSAGQQIAEMGSTASARDELHFEIRKNGKPVNPLDYLPAH